MASPAPSTSVSPGTRVGTFRILRAVGRGGMGEVFLARDTMLGRKVAIKMIRSARPQSERAIEELLREARTTARFNHPHIVTVYAVGLHEGQPYVAMEYLEGRTLREHLRSGPLQQLEAVRICQAIARALSEAHSHRILHRDLKPENVLLPRDGRPRVVDFGLAQQVDDPKDLSDLPSGEASAQASESSRPRARRIAGTPGYLAPEIWRGEGVTEATDVWALGILAYEVLAGHRPFLKSEAEPLSLVICTREPSPPPAQVPGLSKPIARVLERCLQKDPTLRPTAEELVAEFDRLLAPESRGVGEGEPPFRGLLPFAREHSHLYFGREAEVALLVERLRDQSVVPVVGASGTGKSSLVQAGLLCRLEETGPWKSLVLRPGRRPFHVLAHRLLGELPPSAPPSQAQCSTIGYEDREPAPVSQTTEGLVQTTSESGPREADIAALAERLIDNPLQLSLELIRLAEQSGCRVLLVVDQIEEAHSLAPDLLRRFMLGVCSAADDPLGPVRVVFTLRDDYLSRMATSPEASEALGRAFVLRSPGEEALREALQRPLEVAGYGYESEETVSAMVQSVREEPTSLPLLQFAAAELWERRERTRRVIPREAYQAMGGVAGALARHADGVLSGLDRSGLRVARAMLLRMITLDGGRRMVSRAQVLEGLPDTAGHVLDRLIDARLVAVRVSRSQEEEAEADVGLIHDSLLRSWATLAGWVQESRRELVLLAQLTQAAELWERRGHRPEEVWEGDALQEAVRGLALLSDKPPAAVVRFIEAGVRLQRRATFRRRLLYAVVASALAGTAALFYLQKESAIRRGAEAEREGAGAALLRSDLLEARAKLRTSLEAVDAPLTRSLWWRLQANPLAWQDQVGGGIYDVEFSPDGATIAAASQDQSVYLLDVRNAARRVVRGLGDQTQSIAFSPDGKLLVAASRSGSLRLIDPAGVAGRTLSGPAAAIRDVAFHPQGDRVATGGVDGAVRLWDLATGKILYEAVGHTGMVGSVVFAQGGKTLLSGGFDGNLRFWDTATGQSLFQIHAQEGAIYALALDREGSYVVSGGADQVLRIWDCASHQLVRSLSGRFSAITTLAVSPDRNWIAAGHEDQKIRLWPWNGSEPVVWEGHSDRIRSVAFSRDGQWLVSGGWDRTVRLWSLRQPRAARPLGGHPEVANAAVFSQDDKLIASSGYHDAAVRLWDVETGVTKLVLTGHSAAVEGLSFSPDNKTLASGSYDRTVRLWSLAGGAPDRVWQGPQDRLLGVSFSPDGDSLVSWGFEKSFRLWDVKTGTTRFVFEGHTAGVGTVAFSPDGQRLASASFDDSLRLWNARTGAQEAVLEGSTDDVWGVAFSPDGKSLVSGGAEGVVRLWDLETRTPRVVARPGQRSYCVDFDPLGARVAASGSDGVGRIWRLDNSEVLLLRGHSSEQNTIRFSHKGSLVVTSGEDGTVRLWRAADGRALWNSYALLGKPWRLLNHRGWIDPISGRATEPQLAPRLRAALEKEPFQAQGLTGSWVCVATRDNNVELWDSTSDQPVASIALEGVKHLLPTSWGCAAHNSEGVWFLQPGLPAIRVPEGPWSALGLGPQGVVLARPREAVTVSSQGKLGPGMPIDLGAAALLQTSTALIVGYREGNLEIRDSRNPEQRAALTFKDTPSSPVTAIVQGPSGFVIAGYGNGLLGIWSTETGALVHSERLHGPVSFAAEDRGIVVAASALGDSLAWDLGVFTQPYCDVLRDVWGQIPNEWSEGRAKAAPPPSDHKCEKRRN